MALFSAFQAEIVFTLLLLTICPVKSEDSCREPPPSVENAKPSSTKASYDHMEKVRYICNLGYARSGYPFVLCKSGKWIEHAMKTVCRAKTCGHPGDIFNGRISNYVYEVGQVVRFICNDGYEVKGDSYRKCLVTAKWTGKTPTCERVRCPPLRLSNGRVRGNGQEYEDRVQLSCDEEYELSGSEERTCKADKQWSGEQTDCKEITCEKPVLEFGSVEVEEPITYGTLATFRCDDDRQLEGAQLSACSGINKWSQPDPRCIETCRVPTVGNGNVRQYVDPWFGRARYEEVKDHRVNEGSSLFVNCNNGYVLQPKPMNWDTKKEITCRNGKFADVPSCQRPNCTQTPRSPSHGNVNVAGMRHGDEATYTCNAGYSLRGVWKRTCHIGKWTSNPPTCIENYCPPVELNNRTIKVISGKKIYSQSGYKYRHQAQIEILCEEGYQVPDTSLTKDEKWTCLNSTWTKNDPIDCEPASCRNRPSTPTNGVADITGQNHGDTVTYSCDPGYRLRESRKRTCNLGKWSGRKPYCLEKHCEEFSKKPDQSSVHISGYTTGSVVTYTCDLGYEMEGESTQTCLLGEWSGSQPKCQEAGCWLNVSRHEQIDKPSHDRIYRPGEKSVENTFPDSFYRPGESVKLSCPKTVYVFKNNVSEATCREGKWDPSRPTCIPEPCRKHKPIERGQIEYSSEADGDWSNNDGVATVKCDKGYQIDGPQNQTCRYGNWRPTRKPLKSCVAASCVFTSFEGDIETVSHEESREISCPPGYHIFQDQDEGTFVRTVVASCRHGEWLPNFSECQPDGCLLLPLPDAQFCLSNGTCRAQGIISHGTRVSVECRYGFTWNDLSINNTVSLNCSMGDLQGDNFSKCITDGLGCPDLGTAENSYQTASWPIHGGYFSPGDTLTYSCHPGYVIGMFDESQEITCLESGQWSQEKPVCTAVRCEKPKAPRKGSFWPVKEDYSANETVTFSCDNGYFLEGKYENMTCSADGDWLQWPPKCTYDKGCVTLYQPPHGRLFKESNYTKPGSVVEYICNAGFAIRGPNKITCLLDRTWNYDIPKCEAAEDCYDAPEVNNAVIIAGRKTDYIEGDTVKYQCKEDLIETVDADMSVTCNLHGKWNISKVICKGKRCTVPEFSNPDLLVTYVNEVGQKLHVTPFEDVMPGTNMLSRCTDFYDDRFEGSPRRVCDRGEWTGQKPNCHQNLINDGKAPKANYFVQKVSSYRLSGTATILDDGELEVTKGTSLYLHCYTVWLMKWQLPSSQSDCKSTKRCIINSYSNPGGSYHYSLLLQNMDDSHTGNYSCYSQDRNQYRWDFRINVV